jgi:hypothetical protein
VLTNGTNQFDTTSFATLMYYSAVDVDASNNVYVTTYAIDDETTFAGLYSGVYKFRLVQGS